MGPMGLRQGQASAPAHERRARVSEESIHRAVVQMLERAARPGIAWTHVPSGEARGPGVGGKLKGMGVKPGWPDLLLVKHGVLHGLELKAEGGRVSPAQRACHAQLANAGALVAVAYGLDAALAQLKAWGMVR